MTEKAFHNLSNAELKDRIDELERSVRDIGPRLTEFETNARLLRAEMGRYTQLMNNAKQELERRNRPAAEPEVSEHAMLRYIERVHGIDLEALRAQILTPPVVAAMNAGASGITVDSFKFVLHGYKIVTVLGEDQRPRKSDMKRGKWVKQPRDEIESGIAEYEEERAA